MTWLEVIYPPKNLEEPPKEEPKPRFSRRINRGESSERRPLSGEFS